MIQEHVLPDYADICAAHNRLGGHVVRTPLLRCDALDSLVKRPVFVKAENLQKTGSFKYRGASNRIKLLDQVQKKNGVVAYSSGNHAQGIAAAAAEAGVPAVIVMPNDVPSVKSDGVLARGAKIVGYDRLRENREEIGARIAQERGAVLIPPYDDAMVMAGQGTVGIECAEQFIEQGISPEALIVNAGGGGLTAGIALAWAEHCPNAAIYTAEPEGFDDHKRSFEAGRRLQNVALGGSICDALLTPEPGLLTFEINRHLVRAGLSADDEAVFEAMRFAFLHLKIVLEPGGAMALAIAMLGHVPGDGPLCVLATGGNVDPALFTRVLKG